MLPFIRAPVGYEHVRPLPVIVMTGWLILGPGILEFVYVSFTRATLPDNLVSLMLIATWESKRRWSQHRATVDDVIRAKAFEARVSGQEAQAQRRAAPDPDAVKPDVAELGDSRKRRR